MKNHQTEPFTFSSPQIIEIELVLAKAIQLFHESPNTHEIKGNVQDFFINFCYDRNYPLKETLEITNPLLKKGINIQMKDLVPESKRGQEHFVRGTLFAMLCKSGAVWDETKTDEMLTKFCDLTSVSKEFASPIIAILIKQRKRDVIEKDLYDFLGKRIAPISDEQKRKDMGEEVIRAFAEELKLEPKYIKGVLRAKKQKDEAERKRILEYKEKHEKKLDDIETR